MALPVLRKYPQENRTATFDFSAKLAAGDSLTGSPTITASAGITTSGASISVGLAQVYVHVSGGASGSDYEVRVEVDTVAGDHLKEIVSVEVRDDAN